jgi:uncharacterized protein HemX
MSTKYIVGGLLVIAVGGGGYYYYTIKQKRYADDMARIKIESDRAYEQLNRQNQEREQRDQEESLKQAEETRKQDRTQRICKMQTINDFRDFWLWENGEISGQVAMLLDRLAVYPDELATHIRSFKQDAGCS